MRLLSRVVWSEGMHLAQHHFQTQSRYFEDLAAFTLSSLFFRGYGFAGLEPDAEALLNGTVSIPHARGMMPDGTPFHFPDEPAPAPLDVRDRFSPTHDAHRILLALPEYRPEGGNTRLDMRDNGDARYIAAAEPVPDETTGQNERAVAVARKNFRLLLDTDDADGLVTMPVARIRRDGAGHFVYDAEYVPPCIQIGASRRLMELLARLIEMLEAKADAMAEERRREGDVAEYAAREVAGFWLTHAVHSSLGPLRHLFQTRTAHPEQLYMEMARLAGALCTFALDADPRTLPLYDHDGLDGCFTALDRQIRRSLEVVLPSNCIPVTLRPAQPGFHMGMVQDERVFQRAHWFLGVRSSAGQGAVIANVPKLVKVCSGGDDIMKLVQRSLPGLPLEHVQAPPGEISPRLGTQYFRVGTQPSAGTPGEPCWKLMLRSKEVGVYVPGAIPDAELELAIVVAP
jgi:type VI secretion system protein ImpJ